MDLIERSSYCASALAQYTHRPVSVKAFLRLHDISTAEGAQDFPIPIHGSPSFGLLMLGKSPAGKPRGLTRNSATSPNRSSPYTRCFWLPPGPEYVGGTGRQARDQHGRTYGDGELV